MLAHDVVITCGLAMSFVDANGGCQDHDVKHITEHPTGVTHSVMT